MPINTKLCPLCGNTNLCALTAGQNIEHCWCFHSTLNKDALSLVAKNVQGKVCICQTCAEKAVKLAIKAK